MRPIPLSVIAWTSPVARSGTAHCPSGLPKGLGHIRTGEGV